ncbi:hypothetical protein BT96DRAFT_970027 [Gymnopus androsaceus JB14]|uniref:J domain-containing protein n=1 Tax=Gymnopus androsaceus JB14 TaxID=1447944 RepID=A0A6A4IC04_9AGAR|nr:hypothetical protein BT96DRAFT_970027 [Gymnopus androsaceus JB14]
MYALPVASTRHAWSKARFISSSPSSGSFRFPNHPNPSPYEVFHLPYGCNQQQIKERYYELVRIYHPDKVGASMSSEAAHARFQAITAAYDSLRKGGRIGLKNAHMFDEYADEIARRKNIFYKHNQFRNRGPNPARGYEPRYSWNSNADDRWKDQMILAFGIVSIIIGVFPGLVLLPGNIRHRHNEAVKNLSQAKLEASEYGEQRRLEMKSRSKGNPVVKKRERSTIFVENLPWSNLKLLRIARHSSELGDPYCSKEDTRGLVGYVIGSQYKICMSWQ